MATQPFTVNVEPETLAAGQALAAVVTAAKKGGLGAALAALPELIPLIQAIPQIPAEAVANPEAEVMTVAVLGQLLFDALKA